MTADDLDADRVERAEPRHSLHRAADEVADPRFHFPGRSIGKGNGEDLRGVGAALAEDMADACGQHAGLAGPGASEHQ